jgi:hypothetical protein
MGKERRARPHTAGPNRLNYLCKRGFAKRADSQTCKRDSELHSGNDAMQITEKYFNNARPRISLCDQLPDARQPHGDEGKLGRCKETIQRDQREDADEADGKHN